MFLTTLEIYMHSNFQEINRFDVGGIVRLRYIDFAPVTGRWPENIFRIAAYYHGYSLSLLSWRYCGN